MNKTFFKIALRNLWRNKTYNLLNFVCLTFGLTCAIIAVLNTSDAFNYNKFQKNYNRLYSVEAYVTFFNGEKFPKQCLSASITDLLKVNAPEIEEMTRVAEREFLFVNGNKSFTENGYYADSNFFTNFSFHVLNNRRNVLSDPNSIMISENMAMKLFENTDCIGKTLVTKDGEKQEAFRISGVFSNVPRQSEMQFDFVMPFSRFLANNKDALETGATATRVWALLKQNTNRSLVENKIKNLIKSQESTLNQELFLFPLKDQHLYSYANGKRVWREMQYVVVVGAIGFAILLIACFNFINLAIAINIRRYRETGIKKVFGAGISGIIIQFLGETIIITFISFVSALFLVSQLLPGFNALFHNNIQVVIPDFLTMIYFIAVGLFTSLASGLLPALYLASFNPINLLKGEIATGHNYSVFRQSLIVFQFIIPIILIIFMMVIKTQDKFMREFDLGVDKDKLIVLDNTENIQKHAAAVKAELQTIPGVSAVSYTNCLPGHGSIPLSEISWEGKDASEKLHFWCVNADYDYNKAVTVKVIDGRFFDPSYSSDSASYMINDVAAELMKYKNPVGSQITVEGKKGTIIGVFKDYHAIDLAGPIVPVIIRIKPTDQSSLIVKYTTGSFPAVADKIHKVIRHYDPETVFQPVLFRDLASYSDLSKPSRLVGLAFVIALLLACMGLFGLASYTSESRTKEIGIRKVNGATVLSIMRLLLMNSTKWISIAFVLALPLAFIVSNIFLKQFAFRISFPLWTFLAGPAIAYFVTLITVGWQSWRAATRNPVEAMKYE